MATDRSPSQSNDNADPSGLLAFPRPSLAVDVAVLTVAAPALDAVETGGPDEDALALAVLLWRRSAEPQGGEWGLPGSFVRDRERLGPAVLRTLADKCGIGGLEPRQLQVFDDPGRDDRGWVVSVAHVDVVPRDELARPLARRADVALAAIAPVDTLDPGPGPRVVYPDGQTSLPFDHDEIVALAVDDLRDRYRAAPDPARLVPEPFTLLELRRVHEAVLGEELQKDTFRRQMVPHLREVRDRSRGTVGRPARRYRHGVRR